MNQMNMVGMNPGPGGPVGGVPMMNTGSVAPRDSIINMPENMVSKLNTYIYDYFIKRGYHDCARALVQDESFALTTEPSMKASPGHRDVNGVDADPMLTDSKDGDKLKIPDDLPRPNLPNDTQQSSFLLDWFSLFWEMFSATRRKAQTTEGKNYMQNVMRMREQQQNHIFRPQMVPNPLNMRRNGLVPNLQKTVLQNTAGLTPQQLSTLQKNQLMHQMQREHSDMDMNGHRPPSPSSAENAPSPSKRPRLEGTHMNGQQMPPSGRGQGQAMPGQNPQAMLIQNGINPGQMSHAQFRAFQQSGQAAQQKSIQVYAQNLALHHSRSAMNNQGMPNGLMTPGVMPNQNDLMPMPDGQTLMPMGTEYYGTNGQLSQVRPGMQTPGGQNGTHALQDYQMQLMLLEQQNKRRLMMARQEQDNITRADGQGQPPLPGQQGLPPGTSPGSRAGASPNPSEQMKRGTPKMPQSGLPGSPSAGDGLPQGRGSPASVNFGNGGQIPPEMSGSFFMKPDGISMRTPSSNPGFNGPQSMDAAMGRPQPAGTANRMPANWQTGPQPPQPQQQQQQQQPPQQQSAPQQPPQQPGPQAQAMVPQQSQAGQHQPPQERNAMPPPQAPSAGAANPGRSSPQTGAAPPTPQQSNKANPKSKKDNGKNNPKRKKTANATNVTTATATPSSEAEPPPTPTTPQHHNSFNKPAAGATSSTSQQPTSAPSQQPLVQPPDPNQPAFNDMSITESSPFIDFGALDTGDMMLENFDFDTFLNTEGDGTGFGFDPSVPYAADSVETGAGDGLT